MARSNLPTHALSIALSIALLALSAATPAQAQADDPCAELRVAAAQDGHPSFAQRVEGGFGVVVGYMSAVLFHPVPGLSEVAVPVTLDLTFQGAPGGCVPAGTVASDAGGRAFHTRAPLLLDDAGSGTVSATAQDQQRVDPGEGAITALPGVPAGLAISGSSIAGRNTAPFIVVWLVLGAVFFTLRMGFINLRGFAHALKVTRGDYDDPDDPGEVTHFQALSSALSATVGLGNIAGVAVAVGLGGAGAVFWMIVAAFFGMTSKFVEVTLGQKYRTVDDQGRVLGGPMRYLKRGLEKRNLGALGSILAVVYAVFTMGGSFGGGNMFQANQAYSAIDSIWPGGLNPSAFGVFMMVAVGIVILGGIKRIALTAEMVVPLMVGIYVLSAALVLVLNFGHIPDAVGAIVSDAFNGHAVVGGVLGTIVQGFKRAAFSNEAGVGSAAIAHSAAKTDEPVREGLVALLGPFIDTIVVCFATGIVIVISGIDLASTELQGVDLTSAAFSQTLSWFPYVLAFAVSLFAYSTMISWSYYGERSWVFLFGQKTSIIYKLVFLVFTYVGSVATLGAVIDFSDLMILSMAFPNILGLYIMSGEVHSDLSTYMSKLRAGGFTVHKHKD